jgi:hypothetical protein
MSTEQKISSKSITTTEIFDEEGRLTERVVEEWVSYEETPAPNRAGQVYPWWQYPTVTKTEATRNTKGGLAEWPKASALKAEVGNTTVGSNPTPSAHNKE